MASKKIKRPVLAPPTPLYEDVKNKLNHQNLLQDYQELLKESDETRNKLEIAKQRKLILLAEVRFLRRRHKFLLETKSLNQQQYQPVNIENKRKLGKKEKIVNKRDTTRFKLPSLPELKHKGRGVYTGKEVAQKNVTPLLDLNRKVTSRTSKKAASGLTQASDSNYRKRISSMKEAAALNTGTAINLNKSEVFLGGNGNGSGTRMPNFDLNQETSFSGKEAALPTRAPIFDLNEISMEEEFQTSYEPPRFEEPNTGLMRAGNEEQATDMNLSICRNAGEGSSRMGKRKISWQDPVALRV